MRRVSWYDYVFLLGLILIAVGIALWSPALALVAAGGECVTIGFLAALRDRRRPSTPLPVSTHGTSEQSAA